MNKKVLVAVILAASVVGIFNYSSRESSLTTGMEVTKSPPRDSKAPTELSAQSREYVQTERSAEVRKEGKDLVHARDTNAQTDTPYGKTTSPAPSSTYPSTPGQGLTGGHPDFEKFVRGLTPEQWAAMDAAANRLKLLAESQAPIEDIVAAMKNYKTAAGPQGIPGLDLDGVINSLQSTALMMRKSEELQKLIDQYENKKNTTSKEDLSQIAEKIRNLQQEIAIQAKAPS